MLKRYLGEGLATLVGQALHHKKRLNFGFEAETWWKQTGTLHFEEPRVPEGCGFATFLCDSKSFQPVILLINWLCTAENSYLLAIKFCEYELKLELFWKRASPQTTVSGNLGAIREAGTSVPSSPLTNKTRNNEDFLILFVVYNLS